RRPPGRPGWRGRGRAAAARSSRRPPGRSVRAGSSSSPPWPSRAYLDNQPFRNYPAPVKGLLRHCFASGRRSYAGSVDVRSVAAIAALDDPVRAALFTFVRDAGAPVSRESAAAAVGISRKLAAFHLDKLVAVGLVASRIGTGSGRVGRAPRLYELSGQDVQVCVPAREHGTLAEILLAAVLDEQPDERAEQS